MSSVSAGARLLDGAQPPALRTPTPGPASLAWLRRFARVAAPMGPPAAWAALAELEPELRGPSSTIVYEAGRGSNLLDVDGNRYVDLAAGFGSLLLGHAPEAVNDAVREQLGQLSQALGDVHPSTAKIQLLERLAQRLGGPDTQAILGQSGADAVSAALKTAVLHTRRSGVVAFAGAYHGLSYGPLALCGLRESYRAPFAAQLNPEVSFVEYPTDAESLERCLARVRALLERGNVGAVILEPILGRGGCLVPPVEFAPRLLELCRAQGSLLVADEIWTGLGRSGAWLYSAAQGIEADLVCLGKGLGGGLPISACLGRRALLAGWSQSEEVVHTSTFAGAPLACAGALAMLSALESRGLVERAARVGAEWRRELSGAARRSAGELVREVRGAGLMLGIELAPRSGAALALCRRLLGAGYVVSLGGGLRDTLVLTPALDISEQLLAGFVSALADALAQLSSRSAP